MSTPEAPARPLGPSLPSPPGARRPRRSTVLIAVGVLVALVVVAVGTRSATRTDPLDPDNPGGDGAQAVARVLADEGVDVTVARDADALESAEVDSRTTVLVSAPGALGPTTTRRMVAHASGGTLVVVGPGVGLLDLLGVQERSVPTTASAPVAADCGADLGPDLEGLTLEVASADAYPLPGCFGTPDGSILAGGEDGLVLLGAGGILANDQVLRADNAAVALRVLGGGDRLLWYVPDPADLSADEGVGLVSLLPDWLVPSLWMLLAASVAAIVWRARRFGALVSEPLPVSVRADETTRSRGRLYHRAHDRPHAAATLRAATRDRVAARLGITDTSTDTGTDTGTDSGPGPDPVAADVARRTGWDGEEVRWLLSPDAPPPDTDDDLTTLADRLAELDREVRRS